MSRVLKVISHVFLVRGVTKSYFTIDFSSIRHTSSAISGLVLFSRFPLRWRTKGPASSLVKVRAAVALSKLLPVVVAGGAAMLSVVGGCGFPTVRFLFNRALLGGLLLRRLSFVFTIVVPSQSIKFTSLSGPLI